MYKIGQHWKYNYGSFIIYEILEIPPILGGINYIKAKDISLYNLKIENILLGHPSFQFPNFWVLIKDVSSKENIIEKNISYNGMKCIKCGEFNQYVGNGNQPNGTYKCYSCRS